MHNVNYEVKANKLVITVDIGADAVKAAPPSKSGATKLVGNHRRRMPDPDLGGHLADLRRQRDVEV